MKQFIIIFLLLLVCAAAAFYFYPKLFPEEKIEVLQTAVASKGAIRGTLVETGIIQPQVGAEVKIGARATGEIIAMNVQIGDEVKKGQVIALIDDREIVASIAAQKAALNVARHNLEQVRLTLPKQIEEAEADYAYRKITYNRERELIKKDFTTQDEVDQTKSLADAASAKVQRLKDELMTEVKVLESSIEEIKANILQQEIRLTYTRIIAPIDGVVSDITAQKGETIVSGLQVSNLVTVLDPTRLELWIYVDETDVGQVKAGAGVEYYVDTYQNKVFTGTVEKINPQPETKDNIVYYVAIVKVRKEDAPFLRPEMTAYVKIIIEEKKDILTIPNAAVKFENGKHVVYRVDESGGVQKLEVKIGLRGEDKTELVNGAQDGDVLATKIILPEASGVPGQPAPRGR